MEPTMILLFIMMAVNILPGFLVAGISPLILYWLGLLQPEKEISNEEMMDGSEPLLSDEEKRKE